jgi:hypothetical protein
MDIAQRKEKLASLRHADDMAYKALERETIEGGRDRRLGKTEGCKDRRLGRQLDVKKSEGAADRASKLAISQITYDRGVKKATQNKVGSAISAVFKSPDYASEIPAFNPKDRDADLHLFRTRLIGQISTVPGVSKKQAEDYADQFLAKNGVVLGRMSASQGRAAYGVDTGNVSIQRPK